MRTIEATHLGSRIESLVLEVSTELPPDVLAALRESRERERSPQGRRALDLILENAARAGELGVPICQDTGVFTICLSLGRDTAIAGDLRSEASAAVARASKRGALRSSLVREPFDGRINTQDNSPPLLDIELSGTGDTTLGVMAKGGGSEMASRMTMLPPGAGWDGVLEFAVAVAAEVGARSCPPLVMGIGVGGSFDRAPLLSKKALLTPLDAGRDAVAAEREAELLDAVNRLGIGPGAVGGTITCMGVRLVTAPCHIANLPVAVSVNCHALRRKAVTI
jgi:tartrate/fumarate subfamily iron-sulfur-dependent hydro-lyase alpha chain